MPLFVPILRLLMLFLNVYDSYKTLKLPPPSSKNAGRPSIRAMSQRKRDMKGCLAVWIVWVALSMYERMVENIICLLIPFYNEFKSLALLFLILTRARGAEPIYLHLIRPMLKPYTSTLDGILDVMLMVGDFVFALSMYPIHLVMEWWHRLNAGRSDGFVTGRESTSSEYSSGADISDIASSLLENSAVPASSRHSESRSSESRRRSGGHAIAGECTRVGNSKPGSSLSKMQRATNGKGTSHSKSSIQSDSQPKSHGSILPDTEPKLPMRSDASSQHQIWHPPKVSVSDDEDEILQAALLKQEQQKLDEWRQYPAFPSAYPPTPIAVTSTLVTATLATYPAIEEEPRQDFLPSLLPQRELLNSSPAVDTSDMTINTTRNSISMSGDSSDDSMDDEDQFNVTLRTPLPQMGNFRSRLQPASPLSTMSSAASIISRPSALTTTDVGSPLKADSDTLSDSPSSADVAISAPIIGKKRAHPRGNSYTLSNRVRQVHDSDSLETSDTGSAPIMLAIRPQNGKSLTNSVLRGEASSRTSDIVSGGTEGNDLAKENTLRFAPPEEKRRKVIRSSAVTTKAVAVSRGPRAGNTSSSLPSLPPKGRPLERSLTRSRLQPTKELNKRKEDNGGRS